MLANNKDNSNIAVAFGAVVDTPDSRTQEPTVVNNKDNKESDISINKSNRLHNTKDIAPMRIWAVISCAAKSSLLAYFQRVNILPRGKRQELKIWEDKRY